MAASITSGRRHQSGYAALHYIRLIFPAGQSSPNISTWLLQSIASHCLLRLVIYPLHELSQKIIRVLTASITIKWNDILNVWSRRWLVNNRSGLFKESAPPPSSVTDPAGSSGIALSKLEIFLYLKISNSKYLFRWYWTGYWSKCPSLE